jgi:uncharacterized protein (TIGR03083 family)
LSVAVTPGALESTAEAVVAALRPGVGLDWSRTAGTLDWTVEATVAHMAAGIAKHLIYLTSRSSRFIAVATGRWPDATQEEMLDAIVGCAAAMANAARQSPPGSMGFHVSGMHDAEGFLAMDVVDLLVHAEDVTQGLGLDFSPSDELCEVALDFGHPEYAGRRPAWPTLLWVWGRPHPATSSWGAAPAQRSDQSEMPLEFALDDVTGEWRPTRWASS